MSNKLKKLAALKVRQWMPNWDDAKYEPAPPRSKPQDHFFLFSMNAYDLRRLSGIYRRDATKQPTEDMGIQRRYIPEKSAEIYKYILDGFPLSKINRSRLVDQSELHTLRMPGWLSTAVVVNILGATAERGNKHSKVPKADLITIQEGPDNTANIMIPQHCLEVSWEPKIHPIEIIDGQHRLWALEESEETESLWSAETRSALLKFQIPVIAFYSLDVTWQAYLFYTINQLPKKVDPSLVYDLYPLLRAEEWLERFEGPEVYRHTRAQDLTLLLWSNSISPWKDRISRLGREKGKVTQNAFVRSLIATFIKRYVPSEKKQIGGLFGSLRGAHDLVLEWTREQQAAFLIMIWQNVEKELSDSQAPWAEELRTTFGVEATSTKRAANPFTSHLSLLTTDQGVRCILSIMNDLFVLAYEEDKSLLDHFDWIRDNRTIPDDEAVESALKMLKRTLKKACEFANAIAKILAGFDWRTSSALDQKHPQHDRQASYRGSSGYSAIRRHALQFVADSGKVALAKYANTVLLQTGYTPEEADE